MQIEGKATHSDQLERWLGSDAVHRVSQAMEEFYYPIAVHGVPGRVYAMPGGDFKGEIRAGQECSAVDRAMATEERLRRELRAKLAQQAIWQDGRLRSALDHRHYSFASISALIAAATTAGKRMDYIFQKTGVASNAIGNSNDLWTRAGFPSAGAAGAAAPGGTVPDKSSAGALPFANASVNANTTHFTTGYATASVVSNTLLLYDRLFAVAKTMASTGTEAVTGVPTRYTSQTSTDSDYIGGTFCFPSNPTTVLANTAHNWTVCQYTDQGGNTGQSFPSIVGVAACVVGGVDLVIGNWFMPLAAGDVGVKALTQMQCSASVATGTIDFVLGHPIAFFPCPVANLICTVDGIGTAFNLAFIFDNACLAFLEMPKPATTATNYSGQVTTVSE